MFIKKSFKCFKNFNAFLCIFRWGKGWTNACICVGTHSQPFTTDLLDGFWWDLVKMKYLWSRTCLEAVKPDPPRVGQILITGVPFFKELLSPDQKAIATNRMHSNNLEACEKNCWTLLLVPIRSHNFDTILTFFLTKSFLCILMQFLWNFM